MTGVDSRILQLDPVLDFQPDDVIPIVRGTDNKTITGDLLRGPSNVFATLALDDERLIRGDGGVAGIQTTGINVDNLDNMVGVNDFIATGNLQGANLGGTNTGDNPLYIDYAGAAAQYGTLAGVIDSANTVYTVAQGSYTAGTLIVYLNGIPTIAFTETTPGSGVFTMDQAPSSAAPFPDTLMVTYHA
jgi:hypothetical protein